jgi:hypothetical protein
VARADQGSSLLSTDTLRKASEAVGSMLSGAVSTLAGPATSLASAASSVVSGVAGWVGSIWDQIRSHTAREGAGGATPPEPVRREVRLGGLAIPGVEVGEARAAERWFHGLSHRDQQWYQGYLGALQERQRNLSLMLSRRIDDRWVADRRQRETLRREVLEGARQQGLNEKDIRAARRVVLVDQDPGRRRQALSLYGFGQQGTSQPGTQGAAPPSGPDQVPAVATASATQGSSARPPVVPATGPGVGATEADLQDRPAAYNSNNNTVFFSTALLQGEGARGERARRVVVGHEFAHMQADRNLTVSDDWRAEHQLAFGLGLNHAYLGVTGTPQVREQKTRELAQIFSDFSVSGRDARANASHALENRDEYYASMASLWMAGRERPEVRQAIEAFDPNIARLLHQVEHDRLPSDTEFLSGMSLGRLSRDYGIPREELEAFRGWRHDAEVRERLEHYLHHLAGAGACEYAAGTQLTGSHLGRHSHGHGEAGLTAAGGPSGQASARVAGISGLSSRTSRASSGSLSAGLSSQTRVSPSPFSASAGQGSAVSRSSAGLGRVWMPHQTPRPPEGRDPAQAGKEREKRPGEGEDRYDPSLDLNQDGTVDEKERQAARGRVLGRAVGDAAASARSGVPQRPRVASGATGQAGHAVGAQVNRESGRPGLLRGAQAPGESGLLRGGGLPAGQARRLRLYHEAHEVLARGAGGRIDRRDMVHLGRLSAEASGCRALADALEGLVVSPQGPQKMMRLFRGLGRRPQAAAAFAEGFARVAQMAPERAVGTLLLTTDRSGGREAVAQLFRGLSGGPRGAAALGRLLEASTRTPGALRGTWELLETLSAPREESLAGAAHLARSLARASRSREGALGMVRAMANLLEGEGGGLRTATLLGRLGGEPEGARALGTFLTRLSARPEGARELGRVLCRASASREGARQVLGALERVAASETGRRQVARLFENLATTPLGARLLAHLGHESNAPGLARLLERVASSTQAGPSLGRALARLQADPRAAAEMEVFRARASASDSLLLTVTRLERAALPRVSRAVRPEDGPPATVLGPRGPGAGGPGPRELQLRSGPLLEGGARPGSSGSGSARGFRVENPIWESLVGESPSSSQGKLASSGAAREGTSWRGHGPDLPGGGGGPSGAGRPGALRDLGTPAGPAAGPGDLARTGSGAVRDPGTWRVSDSDLPGGVRGGPLSGAGSSAVREPGAAPRGVDQLLTSGPRPAGSSPSAREFSPHPLETGAFRETTGGGKAPPERPAPSGAWPEVSPRPPAADAPWLVGRPAGWDLAGQALGLESPERRRERRAPELASPASSSGPEPERRPIPFRPADFYSDEVLRQVRICGECGFRLSPTGSCARCAVAACRSVR